MSAPSPAGRPEWNDEDYSLVLGAIERLEAAWKELPGPNLAEFLPTPSGDPRRIGTLVRLVDVDRQWRCRRGMRKELDCYLTQWPELRGNAELADLFNETIEQPAFRPPSAPAAAQDVPSVSPPPTPLQPWAIRILCPACQQRIEIVDDSPEPEMNCPSCGSGFSLADRGIPLDHSQGGQGRIRRRIAHFELTEQLGMGAFGSVWKARDTQLDTLVALKIPRSAQLGPEEVERFMREARAAAQLHHPNIVNIQAVGRDGDLLYIVSEYIDGVSLDKWKLGRTLDFPETARLAVMIAEALHFAHENQVTHRDLKPQNILMDEVGEPHLTDFGLAKREAEMTMTVEGQILGTPAYLPPEQASGRSHEADRRSDVYSLGVVLFELLTGVLPFQGTRFAVIRQHLESEPPVPRGLNPQVPRDLETICLKCLEKDPRRRYQTAKELADDSRRYLSREPILARPIGGPERLWRWCRRNPLLAALWVVGALLLLVATAGYVTTSRALHQMVSAQQERARAQIEALRKAEISQVPYLIDALKPVSDDIAQQLRQSLAAPDLDEKERLRLSLATVAEDEGHVAYLRERLLSAEAAELLVIRASLLPYCGELTDDLWQTVEDRAAALGCRFRAACALATFDPTSPRWRGAGKTVVEALVAENPLVAATWVEAFRPVRQSLLPALQAIFRDRQRSDSDRSLAASILADHAADRPEVLADLLADAEARHFAMFLAKLRLHGDRAAATLTAHAAEKPPDGTTAGQERFASRQANLAIALLLCGRPERTWRLLRHTPDPSARSWIVHRLAPLNAVPRAIIRRLGEEQDVSARRALILSLGEFPPERLPAGDRAALIPRLLELYRDDPDPGMHAAAEWLLRQWKQQAKIRTIDQQLGTGKVMGRRQWYITRTFLAPREEDSSRRGEMNTSVPSKMGHTMVLLSGPVEFIMGSPDDEKDHRSDEKLHRKRIDHGFAIASKEVTVAQFNHFLSISHPEKHRAPEPDCPMLGVMWYEAAAYCNWLSKQEGIAEDQWCYLPNAFGKYDEGMKLASDWPKLTGYRLPSEAEWEYACRAGAVTSRYYGRTDELLDRYAWYSAATKDERNFPVGGLKPNDFGLFDTLGNQFEWCQDPDGGYTVPKDAKVGGYRPPKDAETVNNSDCRVLRGGAFYSLPRYVRCAYRDNNLPTMARNTDMGFRVARTYN